MLNQGFLIIKANIMSNIHNYYPIYILSICAEIILIGITMVRIDLYSHIQIKLKIQSELKRYSEY